MRVRTVGACLAAAVLGLVAASRARADVVVNTGNPDGLMAMASRPDNPGAGKTEIEAADDFVLNSSSLLTNGTFTGLLTGASPTINDVRVEIYRVFPADSNVPPDLRVPTRVNSPSDVELDDRDTASQNLSFTTTTLNAHFTASNSVLNGIHPLPNVTTGGDGPVSGQEVQFTVTFTNPFHLPADHYFFVPQVDVSGGEFYWLSAPRPIVPPGVPFAGDLQAWIRNEALQPDWLRVGTDIVGGNPAPTFNGTFELNATAVPEPSPVVLGAAALLGLGCARLRKGVAV